MENQTQFHMKHFYHSVENSPKNCSLKFRWNYPSETKGMGWAESAASLIWLRKSVWWWISAFLLFVNINVSAQITQRGSATNNSQSGTNVGTLSINRPTGVIAGDVMIVSIVQNETDNDNGGLSNVTASGWTLIDGRLIRSDGTSNGDNAWHGTVLYRVAGASEPTSYNFTLPNSRAEMAIGSIVAFSGVNATGGFNADGSAGGPFDVDPVTLNLASSATATATATTLTTTTANAAVIMLAMANDDRTYSNWATTNPAALNELYDNVTAAGDDASVGAAWAVRPTAGSTGNGTVTISASVRNAAILLALRPNCNTVGSASSSPTLCVNTPLTNITHTTTGATGIGTATGLPAGVTAAWASNTITISGTPTAAGTFNYSIPLTGGCGSVNATGTITVSNSVIDWANLQFPGSQTICLGSSVSVFGQIFESGITEAVGSNAAITAQIGVSSSNTNPNTWAAGAWSAATYNVQSGNNDEYTASIGSSLAAGTYFYAFRYSLNGCAWQYGGFNAGGGGFWNGTTNVSGVLTVSPNNTAGSASSTPTLCINTPLTNITHTSTGATGIGTATGLPAGVSAAWASNTITISGTPTASGTFNYSIPLTGGCGTANATGTITVTPANTATLTSAVGTNAQLRCINTAITNITYSTTGATGATFSGLPPGVTGAWASNVVTISGTPTAYGFYNYTVTLTGGCGNVTATGTINVNGLDYGNLQFPGTQTICAGTNFTAFGQVYEPGITEPAGANVNIVAQFGYHTANTDPSTWPAGNWTAATYNVQSGNNDEYSASFGSSLAAGTYFYTFRYAINGCSWQYGGAFAGFWNGTTQSSGVLTVSPTNTAGTASSNPTLCINTALTNITRTTTGATGIGTPTGLPAGVTASWAANVLTISGTPTASGTFNYSIPLTGGCGTVNATGTITVRPNNTVGTASSTPTLCINTALTNITRTTTGATGIGTPTGLPAGVTAAWASNVLTISGTPTASGTFNYSIPLTAGCGAVNATGTITVRPANTITLTSGAGTNNQTICRNTAITNITYSTTGATGATFSGLPAGVSGAWASNVVTISGTATTATTYNYTVTLTGGCGTVTATGSVIVNPLSVGGTIAGSASKCANNAGTLLTLSAYTGSILKWQSSTSSTFTSPTDIVNTAATYTTPANLSATTYYRAVVQSGLCATANSSTATITIRQPGSGTFAYSNYGFCTSTAGAQAVAASNFTGVTGTYSSTAGLVINGTTGAVTPSTSTAGTYVVTYTIPASGGCPVYTTTTNMTIDRAGSGTIAYSPSSMCTGTAGTVSPNITGAGGTGASTWFVASPGTITMDANGVITPSTSSPGTYTITYNRSSSGLCPAYSSNTTVTINASPTISSSTPGSRCGTGSVLLGATSSTGTVYWWDSPTGGTNLASGNTFNTPSISANTTYYADPVTVNGCVAATRTAVTATVLPIPTITATTPGSVCGTGVVALSATASAGTISWFTASSGGTAVATGTSYSPTISSTTTYYVEATSGGCTSASRTAVTGTVNPVPTITSTTPGATCGTGTVVLGATASAGTLSWFAASTGGSSLGTGTSFTAPSISSNTTYYVQATNNGCTSARSAVLASVVGSPSISSVSAGTYCGPGSMTLSVTPSAGASITWYSVSTGGTSLGTGNSFTTPVLSSSATYYAQATVGSCTQPSRTAVTATIYPIPVVNITADYCSVAGKTVLTATGGMLAYAWNTGATTQSIEVDQAGRFKVTVLSSSLCVASDSLQVATELVLNSGFNAGNTGFTTNYTYVADIGGIKSEMYPEGTYAIVPNPNTVHNMFYGKERNGGSGNIMVVNGSPALGAAVWNQNNTTVLPNTTYYFSAWAMSVVNGNNAILQFSINGSQIGTIAYLPNGYSSNSGPYTWVRFYGQWNSGPATSANLSIVNLNTILGGNDFALDDISFGTMSPIALSVSPIINSGTSVCQNDPLILDAGATGGASPFTYAWTGPNGFTSTDDNPVVTASASTTQNGTYTVVITDGFGCQKTANVTVSVSLLPASQTLTASASAVCSAGSTDIVLSSSEVGVYYQLRNNATDANIGSLIPGTGSSLSLPTGVLLANTTFNVLATKYPANCDLEMSNTVSVTISVTPEVNITNQAACSGTVDLTAASVTAGSTGSGTLTYWIDLAATTAVTTPSAVGSGTYYIKSTNGSCFDIEPVVVSINASPSADFTYSAASYCTSGLDPIATVTGTAGVFSSVQAGLVFVNTNTGEIDLSASTPGTYTVRNTVTPTGACSPVSQTRSVIITAAPLAGFNYVSNDLCQSANALNASPIFDAGAAAGTFSTSAGLSLNTTSGVINVSASTPGNYAIVNTRAATGGCPAFSDTTFLDINPYIFTGAVSSSVSDDVICQNETVDLYSSATSYATVLLREKFNGSINNWITTNNSTGGTTFANAAWTLRDDNYNYSGDNYSSNDDSRFYMSNSRAHSGGNTSTILRSPVMSTIGFSTLSLDFFHFYDYRNSGDNAKVQISTNNTTWTDLVTYTSDEGSRTGFTNAVFNLNAYIGLPTVYIRFVFTASNDRAWAIDNVSVTGNSINYGYSWTSSPVGYSSNLQNPTAISPTVNTFYTVTATNGYGCSNPNSPVPVTVNPIPADNAGTDQVICGSGTVSLGATATAGNTYSWSPSATLSSATVAEPTASPTSTTTYVLTETITATGCSDTNAVRVTVSPLPVILSTTPGGRCGPGTVVLSASSSTGTLKWFANAVGGTELSSSGTFITPSISTNTTYFVEATSASCNAATRTAVLATINASPTIASQITPAASYSQFQVATALSVTADAGSGTITGYQWFSNLTATTIGGTLISGANSHTYIPSTSVAGTLYYFCEVTNSNGCTVRSAVSGAIQTLLSPQITNIIGTLPTVPSQLSNSGYRGQTLNITGSNFASNATVTINGIAASVDFMNASLLRVVVNNQGPNSSGNIVVTNPGNGAFVSLPFQYLGYISSGNGSDFGSISTWLGGAMATAGSDITIAHNITLTNSFGLTCNKVTIQDGASLTLGSTIAQLNVNELENQGNLIFTASGTLNIAGTLLMNPGASFTPGNGTVVFNGLSNQPLFSGQSALNFNNLILSGSGNKTLPANAAIQANNLSIGAGTTLNLSTSNARIQLLGDLNINGAIAAGNSNFQFVGTAIQSVSAGAGPAIFGSMEVNKSAGVLLLNSSLQIQDSLVMKAGFVNTQANEIELGSGISNRGLLVYQDGMIAGRMKRWFAAATNSGNATGLFPMGQIYGGVWRKRYLSIEYTEAPTAGGSVTVEFMGIPMLFGNPGTQTTILPANTGGAGFEVGKFSEDGYWKVDNLAGTLIDGEYTIKATAEELAPLAFSQDRLTLVKRVNGGDWFCPGTHLAPEGDLTTTTLGRSNVSGYSNFGFAGELDAPLAIELASMQVTCNGLKPSLTWTTAKETKSQSFLIQESANGRDWADLGTLPAAGNSSELKKYAFSLQGLSGNSTQVRLVLINQAGPNETFRALNIPCGPKTVKGQKPELYPNPTEGLFVVDLKEANPETYEISVVNVMGLEVYGKLHNGGRSSKVTMDLRGLPPGLYQVLISGSESGDVHRLTVVVK
jgi:hypothetical protein